MDLFGRSISISGDGKTFAIGGPLNDGTSGSFSGHQIAEGMGFSVLFSDRGTVLAVGSSKREIAKLY
jgi:hypothetical protein